VRTGGPRGNDAYAGPCVKLAEIDGINALLATRMHVRSRTTRTRSSTPSIKNKQALIDLDR